MHSLAHDGGGDHTRGMTLKSASFLALIGTALVSVLLIWGFISTLLNVARGLVAADLLLSSLIYAFGAFSVAVFFWVFYKQQR